MSEHHRRLAEVAQAAARLRKPAPVPLPRSTWRDHLGMTLLIVLGLLGLVVAGMAAILLLT